MMSENEREVARLAFDNPRYEENLRKLHSLAVRRLEHPPDNAPFMQWLHEERVLWRILAHVESLRHEKRNRIVPLSESFRALFGKAGTQNE